MWRKAKWEALLLLKEVHLTLIRRRWLLRWFLLSSLFEPFLRIRTNNPFSTFGCCQPEQVPICSGDFCPRESLVDLLKIYRSDQMWLQAIDKDGSGSIDQAELSKLGGNMTKVSSAYKGKKSQNSGHLTPFYASAYYSWWHETDLSSYLKRI